MAEDEKFRWEPALDPDSIVIPGLNTAAPTADQIEQIDQLITLKLQVSFVGACLAVADLVNLQQKIDGQFAQIQWLAEHKLLPAVRRYSNGVQPVREAARVSPVVENGVEQSTDNPSDSVLGTVL
jgi:DASH complex subunit ASK1